MKKFISGFLAGALIFGTIGVMAATYIAEPATFKVMVNGEEFKSDPPAMAINGYTYLPLRAMGNALGVPVEWNNELMLAEVGNQMVNKPINIDGNVNVDGISFSQLSVEKQEYLDMYLCRVEVKNTTGKDMDSMLFNISFFDEYGTRIGVANSGIVSNGLKNGETKTATLYSSDDLSKAKTARYEITLVL